PNRGIGSVTLNKFLSMAEEKKHHLFEVLAHEHENDHILNFVQLIRKYQPLFHEQDLLTTINQLVEEIHYNDFIDKSYDSTKLAHRKKEDVKNFILAAD